MGKRSRTKGAAFERAVAAMLRLVGLDAQRGFQARGGGREEPDVVVSLPLHIECKTGAAPNVWAAWRQANDDADAGAVPVIVMHRDQARPGEGATELMVVGLDVGVRMLAHLGATGFFCVEAPQRPVEAPSAATHATPLARAETAASGRARPGNRGVL